MGGSVSRKINYSASRPVIGDNAAVYAHDGETPTSNVILVGLDKTNGEKLWEWSDGINNSNFTSAWDRSEVVVKENNLYFQNGPRGFAINMTNGQTIWKRLIFDFADPISCVPCDLNLIDNYLYRNGTPLNTTENSTEYILRTDLNTGDTDIVYFINISNTGGERTFLSTPIGYVKNNGEQVLIMANPVLYSIDSGRGMEPYLIAYNITTDTIDFRILLDERGPNNTIDGIPKINNGRIFVTLNRMLKCIDAETGKEIWKQSFAGNFHSSDIIIMNGKIYGTYDNEFKTVCIDAETGRVEWENQIAGSTSNIQYHNGILYFVGGNTGDLHVVDASNGTIIAQIQAPSELKGNPNDFFATAITVDSESGILFVQSYTTAYAYKLYR